MPCAKGGGSRPWCVSGRRMADPQPFAGTLVQALRPHHWVKNLLVFVPILAAHRWTEPALWAAAALAFAAFCLCSSAVYLTNDLMDVQDDRAHPVKRHRPLASRRLSPGQAVVIRDWRAQALYGLPAAAIPASRLADGEFVCLETHRNARLFTLRFEDEEVIYAEGLELACPAFLPELA